MSALIDVILPVFLVIGFGYVVAWKGLFSATAVEGLMRFAQNFAVPVLLARSIATASGPVRFSQIRAARLPMPKQQSAPA